MERLLDPHDEELARKVRRSTIATRSLILLAVLLGAVVMVVVVGVAADTNKIVTQVSDKQNSNTPVLEGIEELALEIRSCTDPKGECAKRGQRQQAAALGTIKADTRDVVAASLACQQQGVRGFEAITACVDRTLTAQSPRQR